MNNAQLDTGNNNLDFWVQIWIDLQNNTTTIIVISTIIIIVMALITVLLIFRINPFREILAVLRSIGILFGQAINKKENKYRREVEIGKIDSKRRKVWVYRFLNDLIIDLDLKKRGATPYSFYYLVWISAILLSIILCQLLFGNVSLAILLSPILFMIIMCLLYTKGNLAKDRRIEAIIEAENIISNNIREGLVVAIRNSINMIPMELRADFKDFLDNVEFKGYHIKTALNELNNNLGSITDDFIKKCIVYETEEEPGIVGMFQDIIEVNNIKMELRIGMKKKFERVVSDFIISLLMIFTFLGGIILLFPVVRYFYFRHFIGEILLCIDVLIIAIEFVYITVLRAKEI